MKTIILAALISLSAFGQGKFLNAPTGVMDASGLQMIFPQKTVAALGSAATAGVGTRYTVTDCLNYTCTTGGGPFRVDMVSTGSIWLTANNVLIFGITDVMLGAKNDCQPGTGTPGANICGVGITPTDDTDVLQAYLNTASVSNPVHLMKTGPSYFHGLVLVQAGYTTITGIGPQSGFYMKPGSNADGIGTTGVANSFTAPNNAPGCTNNTVNVQSPGTAPARGKFITLKNFTLNGNRGTFTSATYNRDGNASGVCWQGTTVYNFNFNLISFDYVTLTDIVSLDAPSWNYKVENVGWVNARGLFASETYGTTGASSRLYNGDGFDIIGPSNDVHITDFTAINTGDDGIALNCGNGWTGDILRVTINGYISKDNTAFLRLISYFSTTVKGHINDVVVSNMVGNSVETGITIGTGGGSSAPTTVADWMQRLYVSNSHMKSPSVVTIDGEPQGEIHLSNISWSPILASSGGLCTSTCPAVGFNHATSGKTQMALLDINGLTIYRETGAANGSHLLGGISGATIVRANIRGFQVVNELGGSTGALSYAIDVPTGGAITTLYAQGNDPTLLTAFANTASSGTYSRVTNVLGEITPAMTVAALPTCNAGSETAKASVTDALTPASLAAVVGGGAVHVEVRCDGTSWKVQ